MRQIDGVNEIQEVEIDYGPGPALYRTITGQLECTMECGCLFERTYLVLEGRSEAELGPWKPVETTLQAEELALADLQERPTRRLSRGIRVGLIAAKRRHIIRILALKGERDGFYVVESREERVRREIHEHYEAIAELQRKLEDARAADLADRPVLG